MRRLIVFLALILAAPAAAFDTQAGRLEILDGDREFTGKRLAVGGQILPLPGDPDLAFLEERFGDWVLILVSQGGNACNGSYVWFHARPGDLRFSPDFGTCAEAYDVRERDGVLAVTMARIDPGRPPVTYLWDGARIAEQDAPRRASGMTPGDGPEFWIGRYPFELIEAADYQDRLAAIMDAQTLTEADRLIDLSSPFRVEGGWIVARGCVKFACEAERGAVAVSRADGRVIVALTSPQDGPRLYGDPGGAVPETFTALLAERK
jgi:hypothetical protein